jgi:hypothetical protein
MLAEPATAVAVDGAFYVAWVNHDAKQADIMLAHFNHKGEPAQYTRARESTTRRSHCLAWRSTERRRRAEWAVNVLLDHARRRGGEPRNRYLSLHLDR